MDKILLSFPPLSVNNSRAIIKHLLEMFIERPSYRLQKKLEAMGIGVDFTLEHGEHSQRVEQVYLLGTTEDISDEEISTLL